MTDNIPLQMYHWIILITPKGNQSPSKLYPERPLKVSHLYKNVACWTVAKLP